MSSSMFLTDEEIDAICEGLGANSHAAKRKRLAGMGLIVNSKPNGRPLVLRSHAEAVLSPRPAAEPEALRPALDVPAPVLWEETPLGRMQATERASRAEAAARLAALPRPSRKELRAAAAELERRRKETRAAIVRFHAARQRVLRLKRTPPWANQEAILEFYKLARALSTSTGIPHHVDHIIPLQGKLVSGLHVEGNLQVLPWRDNILKRNTFEVEP
jgi:hypothetical protein